MAMWLGVLLALGFCYAGMTGLCLGMDRHYQQVWRRKPHVLTRRGLRTAGWLLLAGALVPCVAVWGSGVGVVVWIGFVSVGALLVAGLLAYQPRSATALAMVCAPLTLAALVTQLPSV